MKTIKKYASIVKNITGIDFYVATLIETVLEDNFSFEFLPNYNVIDLLIKNQFEGIQGIDLDLRKKSYVIEGIPTFIYERVPPKNREDIREILKSLDLKYYDPLEIALKNESMYVGDSLLIKSYEKEKDVEYSSLLSNNNYSSFINILSEIGKNNSIKLDGKYVDKKVLFNLIYPLYIKSLNTQIINQKKGKETRKKNLSYRGRNRLNIKDNEFEQVALLFKNKEITASKASSILNISRSTFFRRLKECQN